MPKQTYALEKGGPKRLELEWKGAWKNLTVRLDAQEIGVIPNQKALRQGQTFTLPDGSMLEVKLVQQFTSVSLELRRDGQPLPGTSADPEQRLQGAYGVLFLLGAINIVLGLIAVFFQVEFLLMLGLNLISVIMGCIWLTLGFFVRRRSLAALLLALCLYALDSVLFLVSAVDMGANPTSGLFMRVIFFIAMAQGVSALKALRQEAA